MSNMTEEEAKATLDLLITRERLVGHSTGLRDGLNSITEAAENPGLPSSHIDAASITIYRAGWASALLTVAKDLEKRHRALAEEFAQTEKASKA